MWLCVARACKFESVTALAAAVVASSFLLVVTFKAIYSLEPGYLRDHFHPYKPTCPLRLSESFLQRKKGGSPFLEFPSSGIKNSFLYENLSVQTQDLLIHKGF